MDEQENLILRMLRQLMATRRVTQRGLGERLAVLTGETWTQQRVWKVLHGEIELTVDMLIRLCQAFDISLVELLVRAQALREMPPEVRSYLTSLAGGLCATPLYIVLAPGPEPQQPAVASVAVAPHPNPRA